MAELDGVASAAGGLTLNSIHVEGTFPKQSEQPDQPRRSARTRVAPRRRRAAAASTRPPLSVSGVDETNKSLGAITPGQVSSGRYFHSGDGARGDPERELREYGRTSASATR